ncbi:hypothetical protein Q428_09430 [Fervidicella metallireducens AeB]|uniref:Uncharacterized protein n=2 Tax=Fervidicella TaxID=1403538 RepID=A0A017RW76_9CLOT|nr:hypothetical protein Q428_09430 [Fervidicella metallireducens AeB]
MVVNLNCIVLTFLNVKIGASTQVVNFPCAEFVLDSKYAGDVTSSVFVDYSRSLLALFF